MFDNEPFYCNDTGLYSQTTAPIDNWDGWMPASGFVKLLAGREAIGEPGLSVHKFLHRVLASAFTVTKSERYWEGDVSGGFEFGSNFYVAYVGDELPRDLAELHLAWKQSNNGSTFFVGSRPIPLDQLGEAVNDCRAPLIELV